MFTFCFYLDQQKMNENWQADVKLKHSGANNNMDLEKNNDSLDEDFFKDYKPTENDLLTPPKHIIYLLLAVSVTGVTLFAIIRHLIQDLIHDLAGM